MPLGIMSERVVVRYIYRHVDITLDSTQSEVIIHLPRPNEDLMKGYRWDGASGSPRGRKRKREPRRADESITCS